jgi:hypothetical protein
MPPRRTRKRAASGSSRRSGNNSAFLVGLLIFFIVLSGAGFYLLNEERGKHESVEAKAHMLAQENPDAEVFLGGASDDPGVKKK